MSSKDFKNETFMGQDISKYFKIMIKVLILAFIALGIFVAYKVAVFFVPFLVAWLISLMIEPVIKFFMKKFKLKRGLACTFAFILIIAIIGTMLFLLISKLITELTTIVANFSVHYDSIYNLLVGFFTQSKIGNLEVSTEVVSMIQNALSSILKASEGFIFNFFTGIVNTITSLPNFFTALVITILATVFICLDKDFVKDQFNKHVPSKWIAQGKRIIHEMCSVSWNYIKAEAKLSFICFIWVLVSLVTINAFGLKIDYPITMAIAIGFVDLLPLFGAGTVMLPWVVYLYFTGNLPLAIAVLVIWIIWAIIKQIIEPKMVSNEMGLHPLFTLLGMYAGFKLFGVLGLILGPIIILIFRNIFSSLIEKGILKSFFELD